MLEDLKEYAACYFQSVTDVYNTCPRSFWMINPAFEVSKEIQQENAISLNPVPVTCTKT